MSAPRHAVRVGFVIGNQLREIRLLSADKPGGGGLGIMRFQWIADWVNARPQCGLRYELYRPWRRYDALVFLKAMGGRNLELQRRFLARGRPTLFDANVNYYEVSGRFYYDGMQPTAEQTRDAVAMTSAVSAVIADSRFLAERAAAIASKVRWIPDNVNLDLAPPPVEWAPGAGRLPLLWSGQSLKLFELLSVADVLRAFRDRIELRLVTNDLSALRRWYPPQQEEFRRLLDDVPHRIIPFESLSQLLRVYGEGGVALSPRYLDNSYNLGHTEWKITLAMACGRMALAAPVPSYVDVADRSAGAGVRICGTSEAWSEAVEGILAGRCDVAAEGRAARRVVEQHYATSVVAEQHAAFVREVTQGVAEGRI